MKNLSENELYLLFGKITGSLNTNESEELTFLLQDNPEAEEIYNEIVQQFQNKKSSNLAGELKQPEHWKDLKSLFEDHKQKEETPPGKVYNLRTSFKWAVAAILIISSGLLVWNQFVAPQQNRENNVAVNTGKIQLKLQDGSLIDLTADKGKLNTSLAEFNISDSSLAYSTLDKEVSQDGINSLFVPVGMDYKIQLSDGSEVWLNSATQIDFPLAFKGNTREIRIKGEAYLKISKNEKIPFIVHLPNSSVQVLGTSFNVNTYDSLISKVALVEGAVLLKTPEEEFNLVPGKEAFYSTGKNIEVRSFNAKKTLSWRSGLFYFENSGLEEIGKVMKNWYGISIVIENTTLQSRKFTGILNKNRPIQDFLEDLKAISNIDSFFDKKGVLHFK